MATDRRARVLNAIVQDYVKTCEPVGSRAVVERHHLGVSPATVRNDMAALEEAGLIHQPHTSAGRVPTDAGYRQFVDQISSLKPLSRAERAAIERMLYEAVDLDEVITRAVRLLASLTDQVAMVQYPSLQRTALRHIELVPVSENRVLVVIITNAGRVEQRVVVFTSPLAEDELATVRKVLNDELADLQLPALQAGLARAQARLPEGLRLATRRIVQVLEDALGNEAEERVVVSGTANLTKYNVELKNSVFPILDAIEEQVVLLRILAHKEDGLHVEIGRENSSDALSEASVVSTNYVGADQQTVARLGIIGPTRMDYTANMSSVYAVAKYLSEILATN
ncbi:heat-inducible transcriptional repressor HrcA [Trueperella pyogenes]|uniref:Heat-inducible transcription repressor HrcA n=1 Tax=Trueperella pyogenes TaxID=1661 RepID=A0A380M8N1_9ACTO|nr:heat-inducible transcriptional repressor HrcA [Trueperella pyogenes]AJC69489.1 HrcA family transcriptional regulator [Trueperella pyogenes TP8]ALD74136.1 HrcA family transcriptional regulator [Trueperella pyogenes]AWG04520.1 heat-inducible transcriptional repressor HrcA [Trueperella pyogenes]AWG17248.1 heat-inducible transcriptional repressor HrcA [Trueperella pyogenes]AZR04236.1 heat-inducible transcriptional repressor HrcA [Trueperella pyogenes]